MVWGDGGQSASSGADAASKAASQVRSLMKAHRVAPLDRQRRRDWILRPQVEVDQAGCGREPTTRKSAWRIARGETVPPSRRGGGLGGGAGDQGEHGREDEGRIEAHRRRRIVELDDGVGRASGAGSLERGPELKRAGEEFAWRRGIIVTAGDGMCQGQQVGGGPGIVEVLVVEEPLGECGGGAVRVRGPAEREQDAGELAFTEAERLAVAEYLEMQGVGVRGGGRGPGQGGFV